MPVYHAVIEGFFPHSVPHQMQRSCLEVKQCDGKHSLHVPDCVKTVSLKGFQNHFRVGSSAKLLYITVGDQAAAQGIEVVDFAVVADHKPSARGSHGLGTVPGQIQNGQSAVSERNAEIFIRKVSVRIGAAIDHAVAHFPNLF